MKPIYLGLLLTGDPLGVTCQRLRLVLHCCVLLCGAMLGLAMLCYLMKNCRRLGAHLDLNGSRFSGVFRAPLSFPGTFCLQFTFLRTLSPPERSTGWVHMHSVHAGAVQTHFSVLALLLKNSFQKTVFWFRFGVTWPSDSIKNTENDTAENKYFGDYGKCLTGGYGYLRGSTRCEATPAPKRFLGRKTEGGETKSKTFRTRL